MAAPSQRRLLRPGVPVLRRQGGFQVGLRRRVRRLPDDPGVRTLLARLATGDAPDPVTPLQPEGGAADLEQLGVLMAADVVVTPAGTSGWTGHLRAAAALEGDLDVWPRRSRAPVAVVGTGVGAGALLAADAVDLLRGSGVAVTSSTTRADLAAVLVVSAGETPREVADALARRDLPHLLVRASEGEVVVGPFVVPGRTACLRCLDAHEAERDPQWPLLVTQAAEQAAAGRPDGVPLPVDRLQAGVGLAWAARDLVSYVEGHAVSTWSSTVRLGPRVGTVDGRRWLRHPACGCAWPTGAATPA